MMKLKFNYFLLTGALILAVNLMMSTLVYGQSEKVNWLTFEEAIEKSKVEKRKIFVDVYTHWCGWCKKMDKATFQQPHIAKYLNENYYAVKFNAEQKEEINFKDEAYNYVSKGRRGYHELAAKITYGRLSYPTVVFLDGDLNVLQPIPGFQDPKTFEVIMTFFAGNFYMNTPWQSYKDGYKYMDKLAVPVNSSN